MGEAMKRALVLAAMFFATVQSSPATLYYWINSQADNDFSNRLNWNTAADGSGSSPAAFATTDDFHIDKSGADKAVLSATQSTAHDEMRLGYSSGNTGELEITGGVNTIGNTLRVGRLGGTGRLTLSGGTISVPNSYTTFGDGGTAVVMMSGGVLNGDRQTWGQQVGDSSTLTMSGGTINITLTDPTPASNSGALTTSVGNPVLNISGTAVINADKLYINAGGLISMTAGAIHITGALDANPTFNFTEPDIASMVGQIRFDGGVFDVVGDHESLLDAAIGNGNIYTTLAGSAVDAVYSSGTGRTALQIVIPEPASIALMVLGAVFTFRRRNNGVSD